MWSPRWPNAQTHCPRSLTLGRGTCYNHVMINITESAAQHLKTQIQAQDGLGIIFGVRSGGCTGFNYRIEIAKNSPPTRDWITSESQGIKVWVHGSELGMVDGTTIDWQKQDLNTKLVFINPNETARCGCGESFTI